MPDLDGLPSQYELQPISGTPEFEGEAAAPTPEAAREEQAILNSENNFPLSGLVAEGPEMDEATNNFHEGIGSRLEKALPTSNEMVQNQLEDNEKVEKSAGERADMTRSEEEQEPPSEYQLWPVNYTPEYGF